MSTSSIKSQIRRFHVVVVQWTSKKCTKKHVQSCCLAYKTNCLFLFCFFDVGVVVVVVVVVD